MTPNHLNLVFVSFTILIISNSLSSFPIGFEIIDLNGTGSEFVGQAGQWNNTGVISTGIETSICNGTYLLGGYNILAGASNRYFQRVYSGLPEHNMIYYSFTFWLIDSWDLTDSFNIKFDSVLIDGWKFSWTVFQVEYCGAKRKDLGELKIFGRAPHNNSSLNLKVISQLDQPSNDESFGFRDVQLIFLNRTVTEPASACGITSIHPITKECPCRINNLSDLANSSYTCNNCSAGCRSCFGPLSQDCFQCKDTYFFNGTSCVSCASGCAECHGRNVSQCDKCIPNKFRYWNGSCLDTCEFPLQAQEIAGFKYCNYPCSNSEFLYWNGSCLSICKSPLTQKIDGVIKLCEFPCQSTQYLSWNGSCLNSCESPLYQTINYFKNFCNHPCPNPTDYYFSNNTCNPVCSPPFHARTNGTVKFCDSPCLPTQFFYWNQTCHDRCEFPLSVRVEGELKYCEYQCKASEYLFWNGSCLPNCEIPLQSQVEGLNKFCTFPCNSIGYLYWDGECSSVCLYPLTRRIEGLSDKRRFCDFGCGVDAFLSWNGLCFNSCDFPLVPSVYKSRKFCQHPCENFNDYLFWNNTCRSACPTPFVERNEGIIKFCDLPCSKDKFLYWNNSCLDSCQHPLSIKLLGDISICEYQCNSSEYLFWDGSCLASCEAPLKKTIKNGLKYCSLPCSSPSEYYRQETGTCTSECKSPEIIGDQGLYLTCTSNSSTKMMLESNMNFNPGIHQEEIKSSLDDFESTMHQIVNSQILIETSMGIPNDPGMVALILYTKVMQHIRYLAISFPPKLAKIFIEESQDTLLINFGPNIKPEMKSYFEKYALPFAFEKYEFHSSFLVNFFKNLTTLVIVLGVLAIILTFEKIFDKLNHIHPKAFLNRFQVIIKWNLLLQLLISSIDEIVLFSSFELRTLNLNSFQSFISFFFCILMMTAAIALPIRSYYLAKKMKRAKTQIEAREKFNRKLQESQILWIGFKNDSTFKQLFLALIIWRVIFVYLIASWLYEYPLAQTILYIMVSVLMIIYLCKVRPLEDRINFIQLLIYESIILIVNLDVFFLAILDTSQLPALEIRFFLGDVIIYSHFLFNFAAMIFLGLKFSFRIKQMFQLYNIQRANKKKGFFQLILLPLQQITIGFGNIKLLDPIKIVEKAINCDHDLTPKSVNSAGNLKLKSSFSKLISFNNTEVFDSKTQLKIIQESNNIFEDVTTPNYFRKQSLLFRTIEKLKFQEDQNIGTETESDFTEANFRENPIIGFSKFQKPRRFSMRASNMNIDTDANKLGCESNHWIDNGNTSPATGGDEYTPKYSHSNTQLDLNIQKGSSSLSFGKVLEKNLEMNIYDVSPSNIDCFSRPLTRDTEKQTTPDKPEEENKYFDFSFCRQ